MKGYEITGQLQGGKKSRNTTMFKFFKKLTKQAIDDSAHYFNFQNYTWTVSLINSNKAVKPNSYKDRTSPNCATSRDNRGAI